MLRTPLPLALYRGLTRLIGKPLTYRAKRRLAAGGVAASRLAERDGYATLPRPRGPLVWFHGASVGETLSILPLVARMPGAGVLVTSGTAMSAEVLRGRLPDGALHQFAPLDHPGAVQRFLDHWHPDLAVFAESEIWPGFLARAHAKGIPLALVNARLSPRSLARWARIPATARALFGLFDFVTVQDRGTRDGLQPHLRPGVVRHTGNLKAAADPPPARTEELARWRRHLAGRPVWIASSTHPGEDEIVLAAHGLVLAALPQALLILVPRHVERGPEVAALAGRSGRVLQLSGGGRPGAETTVLVADTAGQLGLWYRLAPVVFLGGSLGPAGGHNPWEAISLGAALLTGPRVANAAADYARLRDAGAVETVDDAGRLAAAVLALLQDPARLESRRRAARRMAGGAQTLADLVAADLKEMVGAPVRGRR